jgi:hypothetical protein
MSFGAVFNSHQERWRLPPGWDVLPESCRNHSVHHLMDNACGLLRYDMPHRSRNHQAMAEFNVSVSVHGKEVVRRRHPSTFGERWRFKKPEANRTVRILIDVNGEWSGSGRV